MLQDAKSNAQDEMVDNGTRDLAMVITKLDEALMWLERDMKKKFTWQSTYEHRIPNSYCDGP